jgi:hypothetical protein
MIRITAWVLASCCCLSSPYALPAQSTKLQGTKATLGVDVPSNEVSALPPVPSGASTIFGGSIGKVDRVRDELQLNVYGERPMKILFDERTQLFRDGKKLPLRELKPVDHASVQTTLDGEKIFAISIHILSNLPQGQYQGRVLAYDRSSGELKLDASPAPDPFRVKVPNNVKVTRIGQSSFTANAASLADLKPGSLVEVNFGAQDGKEGVANQIQVLAVPGSTFVFSGNIITLDSGAGFLTIADPRDQQTYRVAFDPRTLPKSQDLRIGQNVRITARYDGNSYVASKVTAYNGDPDAGPAKLP